MVVSLLEQSAGVKRSDNVMHWGGMEEVDACWMTVIATRVGLQKVDLALTDLGVWKVRAPGA